MAQLTFFLSLFISADSTTFFLSDLVEKGKKSLTKQEFLKEFDEFAPKMDVVALGQPGPVDIIRNLTKQISKIEFYIGDESYELVKVKDTWSLPKFYNYPVYHSYLEQNYL